MQFFLQSTGFKIISNLAIVLFIFLFELNRTECLPVMSNKVGDASLFNPDHRFSVGIKSRDWDGLHFVCVFFLKTISMAKSEPPVRRNQVLGGNILVHCRVHDAIIIYKSPWITNHKTATKHQWCTCIFYSQYQVLFLAVAVLFFFFFWSPIKLMVWNEV